MPKEGMEDARTGCIGDRTSRSYPKVEVQKEPMAGIRGTGYLGDTADLRKK
jgi:hypothetical protein